MGTKTHNNYEDLITFTRASKGHALRPVSYGDELIENGTFDSDLSGWDDDSVGTGTATVSSGQVSLSRVNVSNRGSISQSHTLVTGAMYLVSFELVSGAVQVKYKGGSGSRSQYFNGENWNQLTTAGVYQTRFVATGTDGDIELLAISNGVTAVIDNVSVKEVTFDQPDGTLTLFEHPDNVPRVEYDADGNRLGLLVEESRTNLVTDSAGASSDNLTANSSQTSGQANSLTGLNDAFLVQATATGTNYRGQTVSVTLGTSYTASRFLKAGNTNFAQISMGAAGFGSDVYANFDLSDGTVATESNCDASITEMGGGWYRCSITKAATATTSGTSPNYLTPVASGTSTLRTATSGDNVYHFGAQTEAASFPTSYIKTTGSTATRSADVASIPVADFGYNQSAGSFVTQFSVIGDSSSAAYATALTDGTTSNMILQFRQSGTDLRTAVLSGGTDQTVGMTTGSTNVDTLLSFGSAFATNDIAQSLNGLAVQTDSSASIPSGISSLRIGNRDDNTRPLNGHIKSIKYYPRRLTNAQLQEITS